MNEIKFCSLGTRAPTRAVRWDSFIVVHRPNLCIIVHWNDQREHLRARERLASVQERFRSVQAASKSVQAAFRSVQGASQERPGSWSVAAGCGACTDRVCLRTLRLSK